MCEEEIVSYLPLSHVAAQVNDIWISLRFAATTSFAQPDALKVMGLIILVILMYQNPWRLQQITDILSHSLQGSLVETLREVRPTSFLGVPRVWEKMHERMKEVGAKSSGLQKQVVDWAKAKGSLASHNEMDGWVKALFIPARWL